MKQRICMYGIRSHFSRLDKATLKKCQFLFVIRKCVQFIKQIPSHAICRFDYALELLFSAFLKFSAIQLYQAAHCLAAKCFSL